ncbi:unnamed protein product [Acanthoscelides obtectus]|uniref:Uncharacterized protein n=1 Tax=Acanthoscelides obtectus TaxID=200917 RepID=A0A9P0KGI7_ACAOB|nr:unnamed protein product [Acanthoscelides obtectus]CAK1644805.1 hypothetical protein AOBTE_LOCUS13942 [Acanthoscelides obtectus]
MDRKQRLSLQPRSNTGPPQRVLRHTLSQSQIYDNDRAKKKKHRLSPTISTISENETLEMSQVTIAIDAEKHSKSTNTRFSYDNGGFDGGIEKSEKKNMPNRVPSMQSLEVVREQYCCCAKRTKCERKLIIAVTVLSIVIIVLIVVVGVVAGRKEIAEFTGLRLGL